MGQVRFYKLFFLVPVMASQKNCVGFFVGVVHSFRDDLQHLRKSEPTGFCGEKKEKWSGGLIKMSV